ncbi:glycosyltransferase family 39 protein, partial [bacterium]|nr:glycosyltransferase family 39 protein [bacterium]
MKGQNIEKSDKKKFWLLFLIISIVTILNYIPFANLPFFQDDFFHIAYGYQVTKEPLKLLTLRTGERDLRIFPVLFWALTYSFFGTSPIAFHAVNFIFHLLTTLLWMLILSKLTDDWNLSFFSALLYAVYFPITVVVIAPTCMIELCYMLFGLLSFFYYIRYSETGKNLFYYLSLLFFLCAMFSKESAMTFLPIFILYRILIFKGNYKKSPALEILKFIPFLLIIAINSYLALISPVMSALLVFNDFHIKFLRLYSYLFLVVPLIGQIKSLMHIDLTPINQNIEFTAVLVTFILFAIFLALSGYTLLRAKKIEDLKRIVFFLLSTIVPILPVSISMYLRKDFEMMTGWSWYVYVPSIFFTAMIYLFLRDVLFASGFYIPRPIKSLLLIFPVILNIYLFQTYGKNTAFAPQLNWTAIFKEVKEECHSNDNISHLFIFGKISRIIPPCIQMICKRDIETRLVISHNDPRARRLKPLSVFMDENDPRLSNIKKVETVMDYEEFIKKLEKINSYKAFYFFDSSILDLTEIFENMDLQREKNLLIFGADKEKKKLFCMINGFNHEIPKADFWFAKVDTKNGNIGGQIIS